MLFDIFGFHGFICIKCKCMIYIFILQATIVRTLTAFTLQGFHMELLLFFEMHECSLMHDYFCYFYALPIQKSKHTIKSYNVRKQIQITTDVTLRRGFDVFSPSNQTSSSTLVYLSILRDGGLVSCIPLVMMMSPLFFDLASRLKESFNSSWQHLAQCAC